MSEIGSRDSDNAGNFWGYDYVWRDRIPDEDVYRYDYDIDSDTFMDYEEEMGVGDIDYLDEVGGELWEDIEDISETICNNSCECTFGYVCYDKGCVWYEDVMIFNPLFCCTSDICPAGGRCEFADGRRGQCGTGVVDGGMDYTDVSDEDSISADIRDTYSDTGGIDAGVVGCDGGINTTIFWDWSSCPGGREICPTGRTYRINKWRYNSKDYLIFSNYTSADFIDVTDPANPYIAYSGSPYTPWGQDECCQPDDDTEQWDMALLPDNTIGLGMFMNFGWVIFRVNVNAQGNITGFETIKRCRIEKMYIPTSRGAKNATLFYGTEGRLYAAASYLSLCSGGGDGSVEIADITDPVNPKVISHLTDTAPGGLLRVLQLNNRIFIVTTDLYNKKVLIFDVTNPDSPAIASFIELCDSTSIAGIHDFEIWGNRLYVVFRPPRSSTASACVYDMSDPLRPRQIFSVNNLSWEYNNITGIEDFVILSSSSAVPILIYRITNLDAYISIQSEQRFQFTELDGAVLKSPAYLLFYRSAWAYGTVTKIPLSCF